MLVEVLVRVAGDPGEVLQSMAASVADHHRCAGHDAEFHRCVARATHNPLYLVMLDAIGEPIMTVRQGTLSLPGRPSTALAAFSS